MVSLAKDKFLVSFLMIKLLLYSAFFSEIVEAFVPPISFEVSSSTPPLEIITDGIVPLLNSFEFQGAPLYTLNPILDDTETVDVTVFTSSPNVTFTLEYVATDLIKETNETSELFMTWLESDTSDVLGNITLTIPTGAQLPADSSMKGGYGLSGQMSFFCNKDGRSLIRATVTVGKSVPSATHQTGEINFSIEKYCFTASDPCLSCGTCYEGGTCTCKSSATSTVCMTKPSSTVSRIDETNVRLATYNVNGDGIGEDDAALLKRARAIGDQLKSGNAYDVIAVQQIGSEIFRAALQKELEIEFPFIVFKSFKTDDREDSGLFLASKAPFGKVSYAPFVEGFGNGFLLAEIDIGVSTLIMTNLRLESMDPLGSSISIRESQMNQTVSQLRSFIQEVAVEKAVLSLGVVIAGDFNIDSANVNEYNRMLEVLKQPRDVMNEVNVKDTTFGFGDNAINCTSELNARLVEMNVTKCTNGNDIVISSKKRLDYIFAYDIYEIPDGVNVNKDLKLSSLVFSSGSVDMKESIEIGKPYGGVLSDHKLVKVVCKFNAIPDYSVWYGVGSLIVFVILALVIIINRCSIKQENRLPTDADRETSTLKILWKQTIILLTKNFTVLIRNKKALAAQLLVPFVLVAFLQVLQTAIDVNLQNNDANGDRPNSVPLNVAPISRCILKNGYDKCYTLAYTPDDNSDVTRMIENIANSNDIPMEEIISFKDTTYLNEYLFVNPERVSAGVNFDVSSLSDIKYSIQYNKTIVFNNGDVVDLVSKFVLPLQVAVEKEALRIVSDDSSLEFSPTFSNFPHPTVGGADLVAQAGPTFFFGALMFNFVIQVGQIVSEKEFLLRQGMKVMGLNLYIYWFTWFITNAAMNIITSAILICSGLIFQLKFFLLNDPLLYILLFFWFGLSMVSFACICSVFLSKGRTATSIGFALFLVGTILQGFVGILYSNQSNAFLRVLISFLPFALLGQGVSSLSSFALNDDSLGLRWAKRYDDNDFMPINSIYLWYIGLTIGYMLVTVIFDRFFASEDPRLWLRSNIDETANDTGNVPPKEVANETERVNSDDATKTKFAVRIQNLIKTYYSYTLGIVPSKKNDYRAVNGLTLGIEEGELLCLLGPNGAGKTTTIKMLTGVHKVTGGTASIFGNNVRSLSGMIAIQKQMGVCPQHDILWGEMTAREHLRLFCGLKSIPDHLVEAEVEARLKDVQLTKWGDSPTSSYSGGMKRRLSVAMSLIGNPKIIFLDEPTTGMDPVSRRHVWDLIERVKKGRVIVLTTHSMEEADILGDRIAIMKKGELTTIGSSIFLKKQYGDGYRLKLVLDGHADRSFATNVFEGFKLSPSVIQDKPGVFEVRLSKEDTKILPNIVREFESDEAKSAGVLDVILQISSLQEVFLKLAEGQEVSSSNSDPSSPKPADRVIEMVEGSKDGNLDSKTPSATTPTVAPIPSRAELDGISEPSYNFRDQISALMTKNGLLQKAATKTNVCQIVIPGLLLLLLFLLQIFIDGLIGEDGFPEDLQPAATPLDLYDDDYNEYSDCEEPFKVIVSKESSDMYFAVEIEDQKDWIGTYGSPSVSNWAPSEFGTGFLGNVTRGLFDANQVKSHIWADGSQRGPPWCFLKSFLTTMRFSEYPDSKTMVKAMYSKWGDGKDVQGAYIFKDMNQQDNTYAFNVMSNETLTTNADFPKLLNYMTNSIAKSVGPYGNSTVLLTGSADYPSLKRPFEFDIAALVGPILFLYIFQLLFPVITASIVFEKEHSLRECMKMMGLKQHVYWLITYFFALALYCVTVGVLMILAAVMRFDYFITNEISLVLTFLFVWGNVLVAFSFLFSTFFTNTRTATVIGYILVFIFGILGESLTTPYFENPNTPASTLFILQLIPQFVLQRGLIELGNGVAFGRKGVKWAELSLPGENLDTIMLTMIYQWFVIMLLAVYLEAVVPSPIGVKQHPLFPLIWIKNKVFGKSDKPASAAVADKNSVAADGNVLESQYEDVQSERRRVYDNQDIALRVLDLKKTYKGSNGLPDVHAVKNLTIGVSKGECIGFLGPNGAGKSTTMNMICGYFGPTSGTATVFGNDVRFDMDKIHMLLGVCPQENVLWDDLTGRQHLEFYGKIKGTKGAALKKAVDYRLKQVDLLLDGNKRAGAYSGGMKRRLCVAIALVGNPKVVILDEPSTGLDPKSRNDLWNVIREETQRTAVLLTTHSMQEAEALCSRIGIFMSGNLRCIGSADDLKRRLGDGFYVHVVCKNIGDSEKVDSYMKENLPGLQTLNTLNGTMNFQISANDSKLSSILEVLMSSDEDISNRIEDWGVENTTLEQVFVEITKEEKVE